MKKIITIAAVWIISILLSVIWTFENTDVVGSLKAKLKEKQGAPKTDFDSKKSSEEIIAVSNSFNVKAKKVISLKGKTSFLLNNSNNGKFDIEDITILKDASATAA